jgi:hypothetical protein
MDKVSKLCHKWVYVVGSVVELETRRSHSGHASQTREHVTTLDPYRKQKSIVHMSCSLLMNLHRILLDCCLDATHISLDSEQQFGKP